MSEQPTVAFDVVRGHDPVTAPLREGLVECWAATANAGGAVGFPWPPVARADVEAALDALVDRVRAGGAVLVVARDEEGVAGWVALERNDAALVRHWANVRRLQSHPRARGRGIGSSLMEQLVEVARADGLEQLHLTVRGGMGLEAFYTRLGWRVVGAWPRALRVDEHDYRDEVLMMLPLSSAERPAGDRSAVDGSPRE